MIACAAVAAAYGVPGLRNFVQLCAWYLLLNLLLCGAVLLPGVQSANLCVYLPLSPGRLLLCCGAVLAVLRGVLFCFGRAGTRCFAAVLELEGAALSVQAFCDTGFSVQDPLTGQAVVLVDYPAVRRAPPPAARPSRFSMTAHGVSRSDSEITGALHHHCRALCAACRSGQGPAHQQRQCSGHSGRILPPGNTAAMDSSAGQRTGRTAGHPLRSA